jgi:hypothetical protein
VDILLGVEDVRLWEMHRLSSGRVENGSDWQEKEQATARQRR